MMEQFADYTATVRFKEKDTVPVEYIDLLEPDDIIILLYQPKGENLLMSYSKTDRSDEGFTGMLTLLDQTQPETKGKCVIPILRQATANLCDTDSIEAECLFIYQADGTSFKDEKTVSVARFTLPEMGLLRNTTKGVAV